MQIQNIKEKAVRLRKLKYSYNKISSILKVPKSTLHGWFGHKQWSIKIKNSLLNKTLKENWKLFREYVRKAKIIRENNYENARNQAFIQFETFKQDPLFIAGIALYWGEGDKRSPSNIRVSNIDFALLKLFKDFLKKYGDFSEEKIKAGLIIYPDCDKSNCEFFWKEKLSIPENQFHKTQIIKGRHPTKRLPVGICTLGVNNRLFKEKILTWIKLLPKVGLTRV